MDYNVIHPDKGTIGICGIKAKIWLEVFPELKGKINTLYAGSVIFDYLLKQNNGDIVGALKDYKGAIVNKAPVQKVLRVYKEIKRR